MPITIKIKPKVFFDEDLNEFIQTPGGTITLEHSLVAIGKWESKWHVPLLSKSYEKTPEQMLDYIKCMTLEENIDDSVYLGLDKENMESISKYMENKMTATVITPKSKKKSSNYMGSREYTNELIYYYMTAYNIPVEFEKWHITRLLTLIAVCSNEQDEGEKLSADEVTRQQAELNAQRRAAFKKSK